MALPSFSHFCWAQKWILVQVFFTFPTAYCHRHKGNEKTEHLNITAVKKLFLKRNKKKMGGLTHWEHLMEQEHAFWVSAVCIEQVHFLTGPFRSAVYEILPLSQQTLLCYLEDGQRWATNIHDVLNHSKYLMDRLNVFAVCTWLHLMLCCVVRSFRVM